MTQSGSPQPEPPRQDPPAEGEAWTQDAFALLEADAPLIDQQAVWEQVRAGMAPGAPRAGFMASLIAPVRSLLTTRALAAAGMAGAAAIAATVFTLSSGGGRADAALLESARSLSGSTEAALQDGVLEDGELAALQGEAERLLAAIVADPAGLDRLSAGELEALARVLTALEERLRVAEVSATPTFNKVESAAGLATTALRSTAPSHPIVAAIDEQRDERFSVVAAGTQTIDVGEAGSLVLDVRAEGLTLVSTSPGAGWRVEVEEAAGREIEVDFRNGAARVNFEAELEDGVLRTRIEREGIGGAQASGTATATATASASPSATATSGAGDDDEGRDESLVGQAVGTSSTYPVGGAGTVTLLRDADGLVVTASTSSPGWTIEVEQATGREVEADFRNGTQRVKFNAELEDGLVRVRIETESGTSNDSASSSGSSTSSGSGDSSGGGEGGDDDTSESNSGSGGGDDDEEDDDDRSGSNSGPGGGG